MTTDQIEYQYVVEIHRASGSSTVRFGPFPTPQAAGDWCTERRLPGYVVAIITPDAPTDAFSQVWH